MNSFYNKFCNLLEIFSGYTPRSMTETYFNDFSKKSQTDKVLWHLQEYGKITNAQCHSIYGIRHCPSVIRHLRDRFARQKSTYKIENKEMKGFDRFGEYKNYVEYTLVDTAIEECA